MTKEIMDDVESLQFVLAQTNKKPKYQVWVLGYEHTDEEEDCGSANYCLCETLAFSSNDAEKAINYANNLTSKQVKDSISYDADYAIIEVETTVKVDKSSDENIGTIWKARFN